LACNCFHRVPPRKCRRQLSHQAVLARRNILHLESAGCGIDGSNANGNTGTVKRLPAQHDVQACGNPRTCPIHNSPPDAKGFHLPRDAHVERQVPSSRHFDGSSVFKIRGVGVIDDAETWSGGAGPKRSNSGSSARHKVISSWRNSEDAIGPTIIRDCISREGVDLAALNVEGGAEQLNLSASSRLPKLVVDVTADNTGRSQANRRILEFLSGGEIEHTSRTEERTLLVLLAHKSA